MRRALWTCWILAASAGALSAQDAVQPKECLVLPQRSRSRSVVRADAVQAKLVAGAWRTPQAGDAGWTRLLARPKGWFVHQNLRGGYASLQVQVAAPRVMILEARGHTMVYVNGVPRVGDVYRNGWTRLPVSLRKGANELLFYCRRGAFRARLVRPRAQAELWLEEATLPDLIVGQAPQQEAAVVVINASQRSAADLSLWLVAPGGLPKQVARVPTLLPLSLKKIGFQLSGAIPQAAGKRTYKLRLVRTASDTPTVVEETDLTVRVRRPDQVHKRTFRSAIDGSVQYYAVRPATKPSKRSAVVLSLHGAAVEALNQARAYSSKTWAHVVAPTNRRPFGFDWEDWGRLDALEVLAHAQQTLAHDPARVYLTGHSMGGHGTWHLGVTYPDRFAAIAPSAGWISFFTYAGLKRALRGNPMAGILARAGSASHTLTLSRNLLPLGVYILHGAADRNVPVGQARQMRRHLLGIKHPDLGYHEQPKARHWWDASDEPGASCVDWPAMFDLFARRALPPRGSSRRVAFTTASPGVSARCRWLRVEAQVKQHEPSSVQGTHDPHRRRFRLTTTNVARLSLDVSHLPAGKPVQVVLDGQRHQLPWPPKGRVWVRRQVSSAGGTWWPATDPGASVKTPARYGPFKNVFRNRALLVYGTKGTPAENAWALAKVRYDAETFWYRGNGSFDIVADTAFDPAKHPQRNVVLYGHADMNAAWASLLSKSPVQVKRGKVTIGARALSGADLSVLFLRPRAGTTQALVGVVGGTGIPGLRAGDRLPLFVSGTGLPDLLVLGADALTRGSAGIRAAGFFGLDWGLASADLVWSSK